MNESGKCFGLLVLITTPKLAEKAGKLLINEQIPIVNVLHAQGTATSEIMDVLGLGNIDKKIVTAILPQNIKRDIFEKLHQSLKFHTVNSGIAFSIPLTGSSNLIPHMFENQDNKKASLRKEDVIMSETKHSMIIVIVNRGYTAEVMDAAKLAGASGGSVVNSRRIATEEVCNLWGLSTQEEKEIVLIVSDNEKKVDIMKQISKNCGMHSDAKGLVLSFAIDTVMGIKEQEN